MSNTEAELKLRIADSACLSSLLSSPLLGQLATQPPYKQLLETTYFDTADQQLLKSRLSYRLRLADGEWTATVKADGTSDGGLHQRTEYNIPVDNPLPATEPFIDTAIGERLVQAVAGMPLEPIFSTRFERHIIELSTPDGSNIELALDDGNIIAGDKVQRILELELELKSGRPQSLIWLGAALAEDFPLLPEQESKLYRATVLAGMANELGRDIPLASPLKKSSGLLPAQRCFSQIMIYSIHEIIRTQQTYLDAPDDMEALHALRIELRKLNALLQLAKPLLPFEEHLDMEEKLTAWDSRFSSVRDLDSLSAAWHDATGYMNQVIPGYAGRPALTALLTAKRQAEKASFYNTVAAGKLTALLLGIWSYLAEWADQNPDNAQPVFKDFIFENLNLWLIHFLHMGNDLDLSDLDTVHNLRVTGRRLRYTLTVLDPVLPDSTRLLTKRLEKLQDILGKIQDIGLIPLLLKDLIKASASRISHRDAGLITGWQLARSFQARSSYGKVWPKIIKEAAKQKKLKSRKEGVPYKRNPELN
ncbi:CHAD domain-containing protein [Sporomusa aerivorans]|uniref:CYTH and CHAD domain-containing protein n=1 Tax=Sporomusa aerivorans TaxID=204936 RepID=UPI00352AC40D